MGKSKKEQEIFNNQLFRGLVLFRILLLIITPLIVMECYNYVGPTLRSMFSGETKDEAENNFVEMTFLQALVLYILTSILFKAVC
jgi:hypothetical protein